MGTHVIRGLLRRIWGFVCPRRRTDRLIRDHIRARIHVPTRHDGSAHRSILATIASLRGQRQSVLEDWSSLSLCLLRNDTATGLRALKRLCHGLFIIEQLVEIVRHAAGSGHGRELAIANELRSRTVQQVLPLLAAARHDLPGAPEVVRSFLEPQEPSDDRGN